MYFGRQQGKALLFKQMKGALLAEGKTVLVCSINGSYTERRHKSGLFIITPVKPADPYWKPYRLY